MTVWACDGAAGHGKTHRLMQMLEQSLRAAPLAEEQRVLALTFMHGSRRRLDERLRKVHGLQGRFTCVTVDSFAWRIRQRWRSLGRYIGLPDPPVATFEAECEFAAEVLNMPTVKAWVAASFPIVLVDEAQDLTPARLDMVSALSDSVCLLLAADEFQCLDPNLRPNPVAAWLPKVSKPETLVKAQRTKVPELLNAAIAIRDGRAPQAQGKFRLVEGAGLPLASACLASAIAWSGGGSVAVITPSTKGGYVKETVQRVQAGPCGKNKNGPYAIRWEESEHDETERIHAAIHLPEICPLAVAVQTLTALPRSGPVQQTIDWLQRQGRTTGRKVVTRDEIFEALSRYVGLRRQRSISSSSRLVAMTVHQAKNREFDGVVVMWPYTVTGDPEQKRRLLYNAVTRARRWCTVVVQNKTMLTAAPFA